MTLPTAQVKPACQALFWAALVQSLRVFLQCPLRGRCGAAIGLRCGEANASEQGGCSTGRPAHARTWAADWKRQQQFLTQIRSFIAAHLPFPSFCICNPAPLCLSVVLRRTCTVPIPSRSPCSIARLHLTAVAEILDHLAPYPRSRPPAAGAYPQALSPATLPAPRSPGCSPA